MALSVKRISDAKLPSRIWGSNRSPIEMIVDARAARSSLKKAVRLGVSESMQTVSVRKIEMRGKINPLMAHCALWPRDIL